MLLRLMQAASASYQLLRTTRTTQRSLCMQSLLDPLLPLFQPKQSRITLAPLVLSAHERSNNTIVANLGQRLLESFDLRWLAIEFGPVDLRFRLAQYILKRREEKRKVNAR